ncbi:MAG: hypothetical protein FWG87_04845 [Defluviitaleaceae bacterium]|nr:hypothetical protein [Defluviitaleaceae bacterium]
MTQKQHVDYNLGTIDGKPINQNMLDEYLETFERDWSDSEVNLAYTNTTTALYEK